MEVEVTPIRMLQSEMDLGRGEMSFVAHPDMTIQLMLTRVVIGAQCFVTICAVVRWEGYLLEHCEPCQPSVTLHCGDSLKSAMATREFQQRLLGPVFRSLDGIVSNAKSHPSE